MTVAKKPSSSALFLGAFLLALGFGTAEAPAQLGSYASDVIHAGRVAGVALDESESFGFSLAVGDFDGSGLQDLVIGIPKYEVDGVFSAGRVVVLYDYGPDGWSRRSVLDQSQPGVEGDLAVRNWFGWSLAVGDFDRDGLDDLAVGANGDDGPLGDGSVYVFYGSAPLGLSGSRHDRFQRGVAEGGPGDEFGGSLAAGDFDGDGYDDLAIGVPYEQVQGAWDAGAVVVLYGGSVGLSALGSQWFTQWHLGAYNGVDDAEEGDEFGWRLAAGDFNRDGRDDLVVSAFSEDAEGLSHTGALHLLFGDDTGLLSQGSHFSLGDPAAHQRLGVALTTGDFDGDGLLDLAVGANGWDCLQADRCGRVQIFSGTPTGDLLLHPPVSFDQAASDISDSGSDSFGRGLAAGDFDGDGYDDLAIGAAQEDLGAEDSAGAVTILHGSGAGLDPLKAQWWYQGRNGLGEQFESHDEFGKVLLVGQFAGPTPDLIVSAPGESFAGLDTYEGAVQVLFSGIELFADGFDNGSTSAWSAAVP